LRHLPAWPAALLILLASSPAFGQATTRACGVEEVPGAACLMARREIAALPAGPLYWHLDTFRSLEAARKAGAGTGTVVEAFGDIWLFTIDRKGWRPKGGRHVTDIGPLPVAPASSYTAEYLRSIFTPGMTAPLHVHSGPEAFYAVSGDTCLETSDGITVRRGRGNKLVIRGGPPMLLMAIGNAPRRGFALILHDATMPPTTLIHDWQPKGLCQLARTIEQTTP